MWSSDNDLGIEWPISKNKSETSNFASDIDHDYGQTSQEQVRKHTHNVDLGAETSLQSQSHNRGQTALGPDYSSVSPKQTACDFSYWDKMSILQITDEWLMF